MNSRPMAVIALFAAITVAAIVAVFAFCGPGSGPRSTEEATKESGVTIVAPGVRVETDPASGTTSVHAPFTDVEKDAGGTRVDAPGVAVDGHKTDPD